MYVDIDRINIMNQLSMWKVEFTIFLICFDSRLLSPLQTHVSLLRIGTENACMPNWTIEIN